MAVRTRKRGKTYSYIFESGKTDDGTRKVVEKGGFSYLLKKILIRIHFVTLTQQYNAAIT